MDQFYDSVSEIRYYMNHPELKPPGRMNVVQDINGELADYTDHIEFWNQDKSKTLDYALAHELVSDEERDSRIQIGIDD